MDRFQRLQREAMRLHQQRKLAHPLSDEWRRLDRRLLGIYMEQAGEGSCRDWAASGTTASLAES
jgi:aconitase A